MLRKILTKEEREKKEHKNRKIITIVLGIILLFSTFAYFVSDMFGSKGNKLTYNYVKFEQNDYGYWVFSLNGQNFQTRFNPLQTENISIIVTKSIGNYANAPLYFGIEKDDTVPQEGTNEIKINLEEIIARNNFACLDENCSRDYPIKNCSEENIIVFRLSNTNLSTVNEVKKCIYINYAPGELERTTDRFLFRILGLQ